MAIDPTKTLAFRNNNPLNLRPLPDGTKWVGQSGIDTNPASGSFCVFVDPVFGVRAAVKNMRTIVKRGADTIEKMIYVWAPPDDPHMPNHTEAYVARVCAETGLARDGDLGWLKPGPAGAEQIEELARLILAMNTVEAGGRTIDVNTADRGIRLAFGLA